MSKINWELVFINNDEFKDYLNYSDLNELSKFSRLLRLKLKSKIFENIVINNNNNEGLIIDMFDKSDFRNYYYTENPYEIPVNDYITLFKRCLQRFLPYITCVNIKPYASHYQLLEVSNLLNNLTRLSTYGAILSLTAFNNALNNLKSLESLKIEAIHFIQYRGESNRIKPIKLPINLKILKWQHNTVSVCDLEEDPRSIKFNYNQTLSDHSVFQFQPAKFTNLLKFSTQLLMPTFNREFILINPQLIVVNFKICIFNEVALSVLGLIQNVKILEISVDHFYCNLDDIKLNFLNLTSLSFYQVDIRIWKLLELLCISSPNLIELNVDLIYDKNPPVVELVNRVNSLQKLIIKSKTNINLNLKDLSLGTKLKYLEIWDNMHINSVLVSLAKHSNLKVIVFRKGFFDSDYLLSLSQDVTPEPWIFINIEEYIKYYK